MYRSLWTLRAGADAGMCTGRHVCWQVCVLAGMWYVYRQVAVAIQVVSFRARACARKHTCSARLLAHAHLLCFALALRAHLHAPGIRIAHAFHMQSPVWLTYRVFIECS